MMSESGLVRSALEAGRFKSWATTHPGAQRTLNEDGFVNRPELGLWAVADGAGGHMAGDAASRTVVEALDSVPAGLSAGEALAQIRLRLVGAHTALREEAARRGGGMIATTVIVLLARYDHFACLWAGDSRAYLLRDGLLSQVSRDHSLVQELVDAGAITAAEAEGHPRANVITRAVGSDIEPMVLDKVTDRLRAGDRFLLCSDGLSKTLSDADIATILAEAEDAPSERLVLAALARLATDNVTAVTIEVMPT